MALIVVGVLALLLGGLALGWSMARVTRAHRTPDPTPSAPAGNPRALSALELGLGAAANRLNNRLAAIMGYTELSERSRALGGTALAQVRAQTREAGDIVRDLMRLVQPAEPEGRAAHLETVLAALLDRCREQLTELGIDVALEVQPAVSLVGGKQADLISLFSWLLEFARARLAGIDLPRRVAWSAKVLGAGVVVTQVDNGPAIPPGHIPLQLDYFRPADPDFLGHVELALAQRVAQNCGAGLRIEATPQGQVEVTVTLIPGRLLEAPVRRPRRDSPPLGTSLKILVADDDEANRDVMQRLLELEGHSVTVAANGAEALEQIERDDFDVVIADLQMPRLGGRGLYEQASDLRPALARRFVFVTGDDARPISHEFLSRAGQPTVSKPYHVADLIAAVNEIAAW